MKWSHWGRSGCLLGLLLGVITCAEAKLPPAPPLPELGVALREQALENLSSDNYFQRQQAQKLLQQGQLETAQVLPAYLQKASPEGQMRAIQVLQEIYLKLLRMQQEREAVALQSVMDEIRSGDEGVLNRQIDEFLAIHTSLIERASVRALVRLNAILEFQKVPRSYAGISNSDFSKELPVHILIGPNWLGESEDLHHIERLLLLGSDLLGNSRAIYWIDGCPIPKSELQDLAAGLPGVQVETRSQSRLGIAASSANPLTGNINWEITQITPGSSAAHARLQVGDQLIRLEGQVLNTFQELTQQLIPYKPGETINFHLLRKNAPVVELKGSAPESFEEFGLEVDLEFARFLIIKKVTPGSPAESMGLTPLMRIDQINGQGFNSIHQFILLFNQVKTGEELTFHVRRMKEVPVTLRGWVGPYR